MANSTVTITTPIGAGAFTGVGTIPSPFLSISLTGNTTIDTLSISSLGNPLTISAAGGLSAGFSNGSLVLSGATTVASAAFMGQSAIGNTTMGSAQTRAITAQTISGAGGISVGFNAGTMIISAAIGTSASSMGMSAAGNTAGTTSSQTKAITGETISGGGIVSVGFNAGSVVISATQSVAPDSGTALNRSAVGNTTGSTTSDVATLSRLTVSGSLGASVGMSAGTLVIAAPLAGGGGTDINRTALGNTAGSTTSDVATLSQLTISATGNISAGFSAGTLILSVDPGGGISATSMGRTATGNTTVGSTQTAPITAQTISGAGIVSVGFDAGTMVVSATQSVAPASGTAINRSAIGNTAGSTTADVATLSQLTISATGGISAGMSGGSLILSAVTTIASASSMNLTATGNTTGSSSATTRAITAETLSGAGIVSVGFSGNSVIISATQSVAPASGTAVNRAALGNTAGSTTSDVGTLSLLTISATGGISAGFSGGSLILSAVTTAAQTVQSIGGVATGNTTGSSSSTTFDARSVTISGAGVISVGYSSNNILIVSATQSVAPASGTAINRTALGNTAGSTTADVGTLSQLTISATGGISAGFSAGSLILSAVTTVASATSMTLVATGNTTGSSSATTRAITAQTISGAGIISVGYSGATVLISATAPAASGTAMNRSALGNTAGSATSDVATLSQLTISATGGISAGFSAGTLILSAATGAGGAATQFSRLELAPLANTSTSSWAIGTMIAVPFEVQGQLSFNQVVGIASRSLLQTAGTFGPATSAASRAFTLSMTQGSTASIVIYSRQGGISTNSYTSFTSTLAVYSLSYQAGGTVAGAILTSNATKTLTASVAINFPAGSTTSSTSFSSSSTLVSATSVLINYAAAGLTDVAGFQSFLREAAPFAASLSPGNFMIGQMWTSASGSSTAGTAGLQTAMLMNWPASYVVVTAPALGMRNFGATTTTSPLAGVGSTSSVGSAIPGTIPWQALSVAVSDPRPYIYFLAGS